MSSFHMRVGNAEIVALTDMNCPYPTPLRELWPAVPYDAWEPYRELYSDMFEGERMRIEIGCYLVWSRPHRLHRRTPRTAHGGASV